MRILWRALGLGALLAAGLIWTNGTLPASDAPVVHVKAEVKDGAVRLQAEANAPFEYTTYRPSASLYVLDLTGVSAGDPAGARVVASDLVKSYRVISYASGEKPVVRVEILLAQGVEPRLERKDNEDLTLLVSRTADAASPASSMPSPAAPAIVPASAKPRDAKPAATTFGTIRQVHLAQNGGDTEVSITGSGAAGLSRGSSSEPGPFGAGFRGIASDDVGETHRQQSRSSARNPPGSVHTGDISGRDRSSPAGQVQHQEG